MLVVDKLALTSPKTKEFKEVLSNLKIEDKKVLIVVKELEENLILASRNIPNILLIDVTELNVLDLVAASKVLVTKDALKSIEEVLK